MGFLGGSVGKESTCDAGDREKGMATHSSILVWRIPMDRGAWQAAVYRVTKGWTQLSSGITSVSNVTNA